MIRAFKYRIYPSKRQEETLTHHLAICCELYNAALQERRDAWRLERKHITWFDQVYQVTEIRPLRPDVAEIQSATLHQVLKRVDGAFKGFFRRVQKGQQAGYPRFRSVKRYDSLTFRQLSKYVVGERRIQLPRLGGIRIKRSRPVGGLIKSLTIKRAAGRWYAVFVCEVEPRPLLFNPNMIGVDVGLTHFATLSDGTAIENPRYYRTAQRGLRVAQRRVARRKKGSNRRRKAVLLLQRAHETIQNQRADFLHKLSTELINRNGLIAAEKLNIKGMVRSKLAKSISDAGWGLFLNMIAYKAEYAGRVFVQVNPKGTSQTCTCGATVRKALSERWHSCLACGLSLGRDHVSAQVILSRGQADLSGANVDALMSCVAWVDSRFESCRESITSTPVDKTTSFHAAQNSLADRARFERQLTSLDFDALNRAFQDIELLQDARHLFAAMARVLKVNHLVDSDLHFLPCAILFGCGSERHFILLNPVNSKANQSSVP